MSAYAPDVCVALSVKDGERFLARAIASVLAQEGVALELRIHDNGSSDGSLAIADAAAAADPRVVVVRNPVDVGYYGSLNRALAETPARAYALFAADDLMLPGNLAAKLAALDRARADVAFGRAVFIDGEDRATSIWPTLPLPPVLAPGELARHAMPRSECPCPSIVVRTEALRAIGGLDGRVAYCADWLACLELGLDAPVAFLDDPLVAYRVHGANETRGAQRTGRVVIDEQAALARILRDPRCPADVAARADAIAAANLDLGARDVHAAGRRRAADGIAPYALALRAHALEPSAVRIASAAAYAAAAGLPRPRPDRVRAWLDRGSLGDARPVAEMLLRLAGAGATDAAVGCPEADVEAVADVLGPLLDPAGVDVDLVPVDGIHAIAAPGDLVVARDASALAAAAEAAGASVVPYGLEDPLASPPDMARFEAIGRRP